MLVDTFQREKILSDTPNNIDIDIVNVDEAGATALLINFLPLSCRERATAWVDSDHAAA